MALILKGRAKLKGSTVIGKRPYAIDGVFNPELVLDFQKDYYRTNSVAKTFANAITHTRASTATYVDSTGILQTAAINEPRLGHHVWNGTAWVNEGLLHESEARTNLITYSEDLSNSFWNKVLVSVSGNTVIPNTDNNVHEISWSAVPVTNAATYVISFEVEAAGYNFLQVVLSTSLTGNGSFQNFNLSNNTLGQGNTTLFRSIVDMGNGVSKISLEILASATGNSALGLGPRPNDGARREFFVGDGVSGVTINRVQFEQGPTPSSYIPTAGSTVTRSADVLTIPAANLPYPEPVVIGPEIAVGTPDTLGSDWTDNGDGSYTSSGALTSGQLTLAWNNAAITSGKVFRVSGTISGRTQGALGVKLGGGATIPFTTNTDFDLILADGTVGNVQFIELANVGLGFDGTISNISVREINPLALSIQMDGRVTYADTDSFSTVSFYLWQLDANNMIQNRIDTSLSTGELTVRQRSLGVDDYSNGANGYYSPDVLVPINVASRSGSTFVRGAYDGTLASLNSTPVTLPDLSATDLQLGSTYNGTIRTFRMWGQDITDAGLVEATEPSLVPSLSLTFDGTENSFIVEDWTS